MVPSRQSSPFRALSETRVKEAAIWSLYLYSSSAMGLSWELIPLHCVLFFSFFFFCLHNSVSCHTEWKELLHGVGFQYHVGTTDGSTIKISRVLPDRWRAPHSVWQEGRSLTVCRFLTMLLVCSTTQNISRTSTWSRTVSTATFICYAYLRHGGAHVYGYSHHASDCRFHLSMDLKQIKRRRCRDSKAHWHHTVDVLSETLNATGDAAFLHRERLLNELVQVKTLHSLNPVKCTLWWWLCGLPSNVHSGLAPCLSWTTWGSRCPNVYTWAPAKANDVIKLAR